MVFGFCRYPSSVCDSETQLYVKQLEANAKCDPTHSVDNEKTKNHRDDVTSELSLIHI